ncbi:MAG: nucleoside kinase, partial [Coprobacter sp.]|nr:nucleoside kinase [Coprobacter sp.]
MREVTVYCVNLQRPVQVPEGASLLDVCRMIRDEYPVRPLCARVNNKTEDLSFRLYNPKQVEFVDITDRTGFGAYVRSLCFVLYKAVEEVFPGTRLRIEHSLSKGYYGRLTGLPDVSDEVIARIRQRMRAIVEADMPFERVVCPAAEAVEIFRRQGMDDKIALLETLNPLYVVYYRLGDRVDYYQSCLVPSTGYLKVFDLLNYDGGLLLVPPSADCPQRPAGIEPQPKMLEAFEEYVRFNRIAGLSNVGNLNRTILSGRATDLINVTEALHEKKIAALADEIARKNRAGEARIILIAGPSSSGKTTFSKRLSVQLMTHLLRP